MVNFKVGKIVSLYMRIRSPISTTMPSFFLIWFLQIVLRRLFFTLFLRILRHLLFYIYHINKYISQTNWNDSPQWISHSFPSIRLRQFSEIPPFGSVGCQNKGEKETDDPSWYDQFPSWRKSFPSIWITVNNASVIKR